MERSIAMTGRTNDIAFRDLFEQALERCTPGHERDAVALVARIAMVELHHEPRIRLAAVHARLLA
ncbi:MAG TPA: hypothetical protein VFC31_04425 [Candidatus Limnocylindria bacterium]|nr:hypothetical protein [Candidatus Limnocylindria bacterium]